MRKLGVMVVLMVLAGQADAACKDYVGQVISPVSFDKATTALKAVGPKSEFETTSEYALRRTSAVAGASEAVIASTTINRSYIKYDSDKSMLNIDGMAFGQSYFDIKRAFSAAELSHNTYPRETSSGAQIQFVVATEIKYGPSYKSKNAFGATVLVKTFVKTDHVIFDRAAEPTFKNSDRPPYQAAQIPMSAEQAFALKGSIMMAFIVDMSKAFMFSGSKYNQPTLGSPFESQFHYEVLMADMQCGLVMDASGKVLAAPEMN